MAQEKSAKEFFKASERVADLGIIACTGAEELTQKINQHLLRWAREADIQDETFIIDSECPRFSSGDGKGLIKASIRGDDLFFIVDVGNYSCKYKIFGHENCMSPDDHFQDLKRLIQAASGKAHRVSVVMPLLYGSRQHRRNYRESLDCAVALQELQALGVQNIVTFDAHDPRMQNAVPLMGLDNMMPTYQVIKAMIRCVPDLRLDSKHFMVISPDEGAMNRAVYLANNLGVDMGMFYKRRDYSKVINGRNPIVAHEFLGSSVEGKTVLIIDDMISSGESMLDTAKELKERKAKKVIVCCTFGLFTNGLEKFDEFYAKGYIDCVITTNLNYRVPELFTKDWYVEADMSKYIAAIINSLNHNASIGNSLSPTEKIQKIIRKYNSEGYDYYHTLV